ncbi:DUF5801 repeats-in-toxin domain-containing protein [Kiloniella spongiae]|uniref:DUF5801 repeats-in-toxin domain-containing protein n=1 Tax=Kiloniella spongiae TaxID=1489064 RepID=UPI0019510BB0|nr:VCBS domain-containing protein [Kiloniella spongiae]
MTVEVKDDVPTVVENVSNSTDESNLPGDWSIAKGSITADFGADGGEFTAIKLEGFTDASGNPINLADLSSGGHPITTYETVSTDGKSLVLVGYADGKAVFDVYLNKETGDYAYRQYGGGLDHKGGKGIGESLKLIFGYEVTDGDGDTDSGNLTLEVKDSVPTFTDDNTQPVTHDIDEADVLNSPSVTGDLNIDFKADGADADVSFDTAAYEALGLSNGLGDTPLTYSVADNVLTAHAGSEEIFTLSIDPLSGTYNFTLKGQISHPAGQGTNLLNLKLPYTAADGDGDSVSAHVNVAILDHEPAEGTFSFSFATTDIVPAIPGGVEGKFAGGFEDWQANQNQGNTDASPMRIVFDFKPHDNEVVDSLEVTSLPVGVTLYVGGFEPANIVFSNVSGSEVGTLPISIPGADMGQVYLKGAEHSDADIPVTITANISDPDGGLTAELTSSATAIIDAVADKPILSTTAGAGDAIAFVEGFDNIESWNVFNAGVFGREKGNVSLTPNGAFFGPDGTSNPAVAEFLGVTIADFNTAVADNNQGNAGIFFGHSDGTVIQKNVFVTEGQKLTFDFSFFNAESNPDAFNDSAFLVINGEVIPVAQAAAGNVDGGVFEYTFTSTGEVSIGIAIMNEGGAGISPTIILESLTITQAAEHLVQAGEEELIKIPVGVTFPDYVDDSETHLLTLGGVPNDWILNLDESFGHLLPQGSTISDFVTIVSSNVGADGFTTYVLNVGELVDQLDGTLNANIVFDPQDWTSQRLDNGEANKDGPAEVTVTASSIENATDQELTDLNDNSSTSVTVTVDISEESPTVQNADISIDETAGIQTSAESSADNPAYSVQVNDAQNAITGALSDFGFSADAAISAGYYRENARIDMKSDGANDTNPADVSGQESIQFITYRGEDSGLKTIEGDKIYLFSSTSNPAVVLGITDPVFQLNGNGFIDYDDNGHKILIGGTVALSATLDSDLENGTGSSIDMYVEQYTAIDHPVGSSDQFKTNLILEYFVTDDEGDKSNIADIRVRLIDSAPEFNGGEKTSVDEADNTPVVTGDIGIDFGADGSGATVSFDIAAYEALGLTSGGNTPLEFTASGNSLIARVGAKDIFTLTIDPTTGKYTFTLKGPLDHTGVQGEALLDLKLPYLAVDRDGDTVSADVEITVKDKKLVAVDDTDSITENSGLAATGNVITGIDSNPGDTNDTDGQSDNLGSAGLQSIAWNNATGTTVRGQYGTLTFKVDGSYSYKLDDYNPTVNALNVDDKLQETFSYTVTDGDGDIDTADLVIDINGANDAPEIKVVRDELVNSYTDDVQQRAEVTALADGGWVVTWENFNHFLKPVAGISGQAYRADGTKLGDEFEVKRQVFGSEDEQLNPSITGLSGGGWVVTWTGSDLDFNSNVYGRVYNADGNIVGDEIIINTTTENSQESSSVTALSGGGWVVTWTGSDQDGSGSGIFGQVFDQNGNKVNDEFQVNSYTDNDQLSSSVAGLADGGWVVTWVSNDQDGSDEGIYGQVFNANGTNRGDEFLINTTTENAQSEPSVTGLSGNGWVVTWTSYDQDGSASGAYGQAFNTDGSKRGDEFQINSYTNNHQYGPVVSTLADGGWVVVWQSHWQDGSLGGIFGQAFNADGSRQGVEFQVNTYTDGYQSVPTVTGLNDGGWVVTWHTSMSNAPGTDIYSKTFNADGSVRDYGFVANTYTEGSDPVQVFTDLAVSDVDNDLLSSATVTVSDFVEGDVLGFAAGYSLPVGILMNYDSATGVLTLTGDVSPSVYEAVLENVVYSSTSNNPDNSGSAPTRTITVKVNDGSDSSTQTSVDVGVMGVNSAPVIELAFNPGSFGNSYTVVREVPGDLHNNPLNDDFATAIDLTDRSQWGPVTDANSGYVKDGALPSIALEGGISSTFRNGTVDYDMVAVTLVEGEKLIIDIDNGSGPASPNDVDSIVEVFDSAGNLLGSSDNAVNNTVGGLGSVSHLDPYLEFTAPANGNFFVRVKSQTNYPNGDNKINGITGSYKLWLSIDDSGVFKNDYTENGNAVLVFDDLVISDVDNSALSSATVTVSDFVEGDVLGFAAGYSLPPGINAIYDSATGVLTLTGGASLADYESVLENVRYSSISDNPDSLGTTPTRTITVKVNDGSDDSAVISAKVGVLGVNDAPEIEIVPGNQVNYTENSAAVKVFTDLSIVDGDSNTLSSATVTVSDFVEGDVLGFVAGYMLPAGITPVYNPATGVLTLTGGASLADYEAVLENVRYSSTSENPDDSGAATERNITVKVNDGSEDSVVTTTKIGITGVNDIPVAENDIILTNDTSGSITLPDSIVLRNDLDLDNVLNVSSVSNPVNGSVQHNQGAITFTFDAPDINVLGFGAGSALQTVQEHSYARDGFDYVTSGSTDGTPGPDEIIGTGLNDKFSQATVVQRNVWIRDASKPSDEVVHHVKVSGRIKDARDLDFDPNSERYNADFDTFRVTLKAGEIFKIKGFNNPSLKVELFRNVTGEVNNTPVDADFTVGEGYTAPSDGEYYIRISSRDEIPTESDRERPYEIELEINSTDIVSGPDNGNFNYTVSDGILTDDAHVSVQVQEGDTITGTAQNEILIGGANADKLFGNGGNDVLIGKEGDDILVGGTGSDTLTGGNNADTFIFTGPLNSSNQDTVTDYSFGEGDALDVSDLVTFDDATDSGDIGKYLQAKDFGGGVVQLQVNADGLGNDFETVAVLQGLGAGVDNLKVILDDQEYTVGISSV